MNLLGLYCRVSLLFVIFSPHASAATEYASDAPIGHTGILIGDIVSDRRDATLFDVQALELEINQGHAHLVERCGVQTDDSGRYLCSDLPEGRYIVVVHPSKQLEMICCAVSSPVVNTFYPNTTDIASALTVSLKPGNTTVANIRERFVDTHIVKGRLPVGARNVSISISQGDADGYGIILPDAVHYQADLVAFSTIPLPRGRYSLRVQWMVNTSATSFTFHHENISVSVSDSDIDDIVIADSSQYSIEGVIYSAAKAPNKQGEQQGRLVLVSQSDGTEIGAAVLQNGFFAMQEVPAGTYGLKYEGGENFYVKAFTLNNQGGYDQRIVVPEGPGTANLSVSIATDGATIRGSLRSWDGSEVIGEIVAQSQTGSTYTVRTDPSGKFCMTGLGPGDYYLYGWKDLSQVEYANPQVLMKFQQKSRQVSVVNGQSLTDIDLEGLPPDM